MPFRINGAVGQASRNFPFWTPPLLGAIVAWRQRAGSFALWFDGGPDSVPLGGAQRHRGVALRKGADYGSGLLE